jgi:predicted DNA-binding transcriptional regulator YafY
VQRGAVTYLLATVSTHQDVRLFALHRFQTAEMLDEPVVRPKGFDLDKYIATGAFGFGAGNEIKLEAAFSHDAAAHLYETPLSQDQLLKPLDKERVKVSATVSDTSQLRWWLLGFGGEVEVLKPNSLRREIAKAARAAARRYQRS